MSEETNKFKASHFENIEELLNHCDMWIEDYDFDAYCRFFDMGAMEELRKYSILKEKENQQLKSQLQNIHDEFSKYDWENSNPSQLKNQIKSLYYSIFEKGETK